MDVILTTSGDGFDFPVSAAIVGMDDGGATAVALSLFGGNDKGTWWGNKSTATQTAIQERAPIPVNVKYIKAAVEYDLSWLPSADVTVEMKGVGMVSIKVNNIIFNKNWGS